ncbi:MAG: hypothetical protein KAY97_00105 [Chromatiaceae bacterium]|nr:hypothetical protein [Chromatiaceae bacterium]
MRPKTTNSDLPMRMIRRTKKLGSGRLWCGYYFNTTLDGKRQEIPLGHDLATALEKFEQLNARHETLAEEVNAKKKSKNEYQYKYWDDDLKILHRQTKSRAARKSIEYTLTHEELCEMYKQNNGRCALSKIMFDGRKQDGLRIRPYLPSIDRINPGGAYTKENCRLVCAYLNQALNQNGVEMLIKMVGSIIVNNKNLANDLTSGAIK